MEQRYIALLRGINVGGKNKVEMAALRQGLEALGFAAVRTYLNSGNAAFSAEETELPRLTTAIEAMLRARLGLEIPVFVLLQADLAERLAHAPAWWGTGEKDRYDNLICVLPPTTAAEVRAALGEPKAGLEQAETCREVIFWTFDRRQYQKTNWWGKTARAEIGARLTIRTANTLRRLATL